MTVEDTGDESNRLRVTIRPDGITTRELHEHRVVAGPGCRTIQRRKATCRLPRAVSIRAGRRNDHVELSIGWHVKHTPVVVDAGPGDDFVSADVGTQTLFGRRGDDRLRGAYGPDRLDGGDGDDVLDAGAGSLEHVEWLDPPRDRLSCGPGHDRVHEPGQSPVPRGCERMSAVGGIFNYQGIDAHPRPVGRRRVLVEAICDLTASCRYRALLRYRGKEIGRGRLTRFGTEHKMLAVRLDRPLPSSGNLRVVVEGQTREEDGSYPYRFTWVVRAGPVASSR